MNINNLPLNPNPLTWGNVIEERYFYKNDMYYQHLILATYPGIVYKISSFEEEIDYSNKILTRHVIMYINGTKYISFKDTQLNGHAFTRILEPQD